MDARCVTSLTSTSFAHRRKPRPLPSRSSQRRLRSSGLPRFRRTWRRSRAPQRTWPQCDLTDL